VITHKTHSFRLECCRTNFRRSSRPRERLPRHERRAAVRYARPDEPVPPGWVARGDAGVNVAAGAAPRRVHEVRVSHPRLARRRGVPPFAAVVARGAHLVTSDGAVDGEGVVVPALVPGEAVVKMVFEFGGTVSRRRERLVGRDKSLSRLDDFACPRRLWKGMGIQGMAYPRTALVEWTIGLQRIRVTVDITVDMRVSDVPKCLINQHLVLGFNVCEFSRSLGKNATFLY